MENSWRMKTSLFTKTITLVCFTALIAGFLFYRSGKMDSFFQGSPNGGITDNSLKKNTKADSLVKLRQSSSKSLVIAPVYPRKYTVPVKSANFQTKEPTYLSTSKSGPVFRPQHVVVDTSRKTNPFTGNQQKTGINRFANKAGSTKLGSTSIQIDSPAKKRQ